MMGSAFNYKMWRSLGWLETTWFFVLCFFWYMFSISSTHQIINHQINSQISHHRGKDFADRWPSGNMRAEYTPGQYHIYLKENRWTESRGWKHRSLVGPLGAIDGCHLGEGGGKILQMARISGRDFFLGSYLPKGLPRELRVVEDLL